MSKFQGSANMKLTYSQYQNFLVIITVLMLTVCVQAQLSDSRIRNSDDEKMMDLHFLTNSMQDQHTSAKDIEKFLPLTIRAGSTQSQVAQRIADQSVQTWFNSPAVKNSRLGLAATQVQENMSLDGTAKTGFGLKQIEHKFTMQILAFQTAAQFEYTGYMTAKVNHNVAGNETEVEISEKVLKNKNVFLNHSIKSTNRLSTLGMKWNF
ncbi:MAG: hypothetical protein ACK5P5_09575 [Pseudobdellovibrionaceae bacterium]